MSKFDDAIETYKGSFEEKLNRKDYDEALLAAIAKSLGPSIYDKDSSKVACSKKEERDTIRSKFLVGKLGIEDGDHLDEVIKDVCKEMGSSNRFKYRAVFYYLLVEKFGKQDLFVEGATQKSSTSKVKETKAVEAEEVEHTGQHTDDEMIEIGVDAKSAHDVIHNHAIYAAGAGFVPIPIIDLASISAVQFSMIKKIADLYDISFDKARTKSAIAALIGGVYSFELGLITRLLFKGIPLIGPLVGGTAMSAYAYFSTKVIGDIFTDHFASGGDLSLEDVTINKMKKVYKREMKEWKKRNRK